MKFDKFKVLLLFLFLLPIFINGSYVRRRLIEFRDQIANRTRGIANAATTLWYNIAFISTTGSNVPKLFKEKLLSLAPINESEVTIMPAVDAVAKLEAVVGWDQQTSNFLHAEELDKLVKDSIGNGEVLPANADWNQIVSKGLNGRPLWDLMDIVVPSIRDLDFLEKWKPFIENFHIIIVQDGDPSKHLKIPSWAHYELYNRFDIEKTLGEDSWIISKKDASIRNFGFLVSDKELIYTIDDDCLPATEPLSQKQVDAITQHILNLLSPSTPYFYNTIYDPYRPGSDFVRGYPYSLRNGIPTAISHGLWMNQYDYDAPTQLLKVSERNTRYVDVTLTIPYGTLYPMCSMNVAFNKTLIGAAFMQGLMGEGQPWARYDDMFAGWASKVVADHIGVGVKSGAPYIHHNKASNPFTNLKKEYMGLFWQEDVISFMQQVKLTDPKSITASRAYLELADKIEVGLGHINEYFLRLPKAMRTWVKVWEKRFGGNYGEFNCLNPALMERVNIPECVPEITPVASRSSMAPSRSKLETPIPIGNGSSIERLSNDTDSICAIFTITHNEKEFLPVWWRYYSQHAPMSDIWILDHNSEDNSTDLRNFPPGAQVKKVYGDSAWMPHFFINRKVELFIQELLRAGYPCVLFTEVDEIVVPEPTKYPGGLRQYFREFLKSTSVVMRTNGHHVGHLSRGNVGVEPPINFSRPMLEDRHYWVDHWMFNKPLLLKVPVRYVPGHHSCISRKGSSNTQVFDWNLHLVHLHYIDASYCTARETKKLQGAKTKSHPEEFNKGDGLLALKNKDLDSILFDDKVCAHAFLTITDNKVVSPAKWTKAFKFIVDPIPSSVRSVFI